MENKERILKTLKFKDVDRFPNMEIGVWQQTREEWEKQGLPEDIMDNGNILITGNDYFDLEGSEISYIDAWYPYPKFKEKIISEDKDYLVYIDDVGRTRKAKKAGTVKGQRLSMDTYLEFPVKDMDSFLKHKKYFAKNYNKRYPEDWESFKSKANAVDKPLILMNPMDEHFGYYSMLRSWIGTEKLSLLFYDDPKLIHAACEFLTEWIINLLTKAVSEVKFDWCIIHEDLAGKGGPLISPDLFKKFFLSGYKKVVEFLKSNGVQILSVDTDGDFEVLIPLFLEAGIDGFMPMEVAAGMDPVVFRKKYGKSFHMYGGVDKREVAKGKREIANELKKLAPVIEGGGYIPTIDHTVQPGVTLENFNYYLKLKRKILGY